MVLLELIGVSKDFGSYRVVSDVSIQIEKDKVYSIIGPNGAGKTTIFNLITGHLGVSAGLIKLKNKQINGMAINRISEEGLARSFQINNLFPELSVWENIRLAVQSRYPAKYNIWNKLKSYKDINEKTEKIINEVGLTNHANKKSKYLSHGDKRILEIGIALGTNPEILLMDEPTSGMAPEETLQMINFVKKLSEKLTLIVIEHKINLVMDISDEVIVLNQGKVIAQGPPLSVQQNSEVKTAYLGSCE